MKVFMLLAGVGLFSTSTVPESSSSLLEAPRPTARLEFRAAGFSIDALDKAPGTAATQFLTMNLPTSDPLAPNVMVQVIPFAGTLQEYLDLTRKQYEGVAVKILRERKAGDALVWEYSGPVKSVLTHGYVRAEKRADKVYLATALAMESQWPSLGPQLKACVDSFRTEEPRVREAKR